MEKITGVRPKFGLELGSQCTKNNPDLSEFVTTKCLGSKCRKALIRVADVGQSFFRGKISDGPIRRLYDDVIALILLA